MEGPGQSEPEMVAKLVEYHRHSDAISRCFTSTLKVINADQPKADVFSQGKKQPHNVCVPVSAIHTEISFATSGAWDFQKQHPVL